MAQHAMPFLIVNYGAEMVFILDQRLQAQSVASEKASKVLHDVIKAMFAPTFVDELLRPQPLYTPAQTKEIFDRLAHSSIMRLSENSMDKLYDLMTMGCKYQYVTLRHPYEVIELTLNHLLHIKGSLTSESAVLNDVENHLRTLSASLSCGLLAEVRQQLLNFFQGKRVKVSLFLQESMQNSDATMNIPQDMSISPLPTCEAPGTIRYYDNASLVLTETFSHPDSHLTYNTPVATYTPFEPSCRQCKQGRNLYLIDRKKKADGTVATPSATSSSAPQPSARSVAQQQQLGAVAPPPTRAPAPSKPTGALGALNSLSSLVGVNAAPAGTFKLNLFGDANDDEPVANSDTASEVVSTVINISKISKEDIRTNNAELMGVVGDFVVQPSASRPAAAAANDDLLDLMDSA